MFDVIHSIVSITPDRPWGIDIVNYFYLTGISVANFIIASLFYVFKNDKYKNISLFALLLAIAFFIPAPFNLIDDLHQPGRIPNFFLYGWENFPTSPMKWGVLLLMSYFMVLFFSLFLVLKKASEKIIKFIFCIGIIIGCGVEFYTAYIIGILYPFPLIHTPIMPLLFLASALASGSGMLILVYIFVKKYYYKDETSYIFKNISPVTKVMVFAILSDILFRIFWLSFASVFNGNDKYLILDLLSKDGVFTFGIDMGLCLLLPFLISISFLKNNLKFLFLAGFLTALGAWLFRWFLVIGGQSFMKMTPSFLEYRLNLFGEGSIMSIIANWSIAIAMIAFIIVIFENKLAPKQGE